MKFHAINENHLFQKAYNTGKKVVCPSVVVYILPDKHATLLKKENPEKKKINRIGLTVTKRIGNAVQRSRVRRILRAGLREVINQKPIKTGFLIVINAREKALTVKSGDIGKDLFSAFEKLEMFL
jgi:ribonuclease P protein component